MKMYPWQAIFFVVSTKSSIVANHQFLSNARNLDYFFLLVRRRVCMWLQYVYVFKAFNFIHCASEMFTKHVKNYIALLIMKKWRVQFV